MGDKSVFFYFFKEKIMFQSHQIKSNHRVLRKNKEHAYRAQSVASDYTASVLAVQIYTNTNEHSMYIRFLCIFCMQLWKC